MTDLEKKDQWLKEHGKGDLQECTWSEIIECLAFCGLDCPIGWPSCKVNK